MYTLFSRLKLNIHFPLPVSVSCWGKDTLYITSHEYILATSQQRTSLYQYYTLHETLNHMTLILKPRSLCYYTASLTPGSLLHACMHSPASKWLEWRWPGSRLMRSLCTAKVEHTCVHFLLLCVCSLFSCIEEQCLCSVCEHSRTNGICEIWH